MRILHVAAWLAPRYGGPSHALPRMAAALAARGHTVDVFSTNVDGPGTLDVPLGTPILQQGFRVTYFAVHWPRYYTASFGLAAALARAIPGVDVVHIHSLYLFHTFVATLLSRRHGVPYLMRPHGTLDDYHRAHHRGRKAVYEWLIERRNLDRAAGIHYTSEAERRMAEAAGVRTRAFVIPHGIDPSEFSGPGDLGPVLERHPEVAGRRLVTFLGRLSAKKGLDRLLEAVALVRRTRPDIHLVVAGPDDEGLGRGLAEQARRLGLGGAVSFIGFVGGEAKVGLLKRTSVFALPSDDENFALAAVEAMAAGVPVVLSDRVAIREAVASYGAGLVTDRSPSAVAAAIGRLLDSEPLARGCAEAGPRLVTVAYGWARVGRELEAMYEAVTGARPSPARAGTPAWSVQGGVDGSPHP